ncbi:nitronate monooxygenase [Sphingobium sp. AEW010]|nr:MULTISPECIES: nitronate monooxygenase [unclassified Sphingobium]TWC95332.1 nitronate monooxygenase [Sphingobium sp. AEW010]TWD14078.1 nitronate monooxygenase [Sphingobium sp. AEW013]TWD18431.1 nitronate monooxygenase [Sphingobium sp. AEW001]
MYQHVSAATGTDMTFSVYVPEHDGGAKLPVVWYLSGLTCTHANVTENGEVRRLCAALSLIFVAPDTSPHGEGVADGAAGAYDFGLGAVFLIVHPTYERFEAELDLVCEYRPSIVITALGSPRRVLDRIHGYGGSVFSDVVTPEQARKAAAAGADGLILVASGAGGHTGHYSPFALVEEVRSFWDGPLILGGAIGSARAIGAALDLGADFAYMGTHFIAAPESLVVDDNREMLVRASMSDIVTTPAVTGVASNWIRESLDRAGFTPEILEVKKKIDFSNLHGDAKAWKNIWGAGHSVGTTRSIRTVATIVDELVDDFREANFGRSISRWIS